MFGCEIVFLVPMCHLSFAVSFNKGGEGELGENIKRGKIENTFIKCITHVIYKTSN